MVMFSIHEPCTIIEQNEGLSYFSKIVRTDGESARARHSQIVEICSTERAVVAYKSVGKSDWLLFAARHERFR